MSPAAQTQINTSVTPELREAMRETAKARGLTMSQAMREAMAQWIGQPELAEMPPAHRPRSE